MRVQRHSTNTYRLAAAAQTASNPLVQCLLVATMKPKGQLTLWKGVKPAAPDPSAPAAAPGGGGR